MKKEKPIIFNLKDLYLAIKTNSKSNTPLIVNKEFFVRFGMISPEYTGEIKMLSQGDISVPLTIDGISISKRTKEKIEKANGKIL